MSKTIVVKKNGLKNQVNLNSIDAYLIISDANVMSYSILFMIKYMTTILRNSS